MIMKCTNCGSQKLKETQSHIQIFENDGGYFVDDLKVYICTKCGHYEFFNAKYNQK